jgi:hypothetical protein
MDVLIPLFFFALSKKRYAAENPAPSIWPITEYNSYLSAFVLSIKINSKLFNKLNGYEH